MSLIASESVPAHRSAGVTADNYRFPSIGDRARAKAAAVKTSSPSSMRGQAPTAIWLAGDDVAVSPACGDSAIERATRHVNAATAVTLTLPEAGRATSPSAAASRDRSARKLAGNVAGDGAGGKASVAEVSVAAATARVPTSGVARPRTPTLTRGQTTVPSSAFASYAVRAASTNSARTPSASDGSTRANFGRRSNGSRECGALFGGYSAPTPREGGGSGGVAGGGGKNGDPKSFCIGSAAERTLAELRKCADAPASASSAHRDTEQAAAPDVELGAWSAVEAAVGGLVTADADVEDEKTTPSRSAKAKALAECGSNACAVQ